MTVLKHKAGNYMKTIDEIKKEVAKECAEEHFEVIFEAEISVGDYEQAR